MKTYKVIKEFGCAQKGDVLQENEEGLFELNVECDCSDCYSSRSICISSDIADTLATAGYLEEFEEARIEYENILSSLSSGTLLKTQKTEEEYNISIELGGENNTKIDYPKETDDKLKLKEQKYALFEIKTKFGNDFVKNSPFLSKKSALLPFF